MTTMRELYEGVKKQEAAKGRKPDGWENTYEMDCLLNPEKYEKRTCEISTCRLPREQLSADVAEVLDVLNQPDKKVYALIAPAFMGQFGDMVTPGKVRAALKKAGFLGMVEVAVFADILTLKEALEFDAHVTGKEDFQLTSCCCPVWIAMIRGIYGELVPHVPGAVSPMIAAGRAVKKIHSKAVTVFLGPCIAKKKEATEPDIADAVDYVLTFREMQELFDATEIDPAKMQEDEKEHSSTAGRIYARTGGVSEAVKKTVEQLHPERAIMVEPMQADGVMACRKMIEEIKSGKVKANFYEGMACEGGCVGGPRAIIEKDAARDLVNQYGAQAAYRTPLENPYVLELIEKLGFYTVEDFLEKSDILTRDFT